MIKSSNLLTIPVIVLIGYGCSKSTDVVCIPYPLSPIEDVMDNGTYLDSTQCEDYIEWTFKWKECPGASNYHIYVIHENAINPALDFMNIANPILESVQSGWVPGASLSGWKWRVRARVDGQWGEWSEWRTFTVEPPNSDC